MKEKVIITGNNPHYIDQIVNLAKPLGITPVIGEETPITGVICVSDMPPTKATAWVRISSSTSNNVDIALAQDERDKYNIQVVAIINMASKGPICTHHIAVCSRGKIRSYQSINDLFIFLLEYAVGFAK